MVHGVSRRCTPIHRPPRMATRSTRPSCATGPSPTNCPGSGSELALARFTWNGIAQQLIYRLQDAGERRRIASLARGLDHHALDPADHELAPAEHGWIPVASS